MPFVKGQSGNPDGRPPSRQTEYRREIRKARQLFADGLFEVSESAMDLARGCYVVLMRDERARKWVKPPSLEAVEQAIELAPHTIRVYQQPPDLGAVQLVWERVAGKVPQRHEHEIRQLIVAITEDHATLARLIRDAVPPESLPAVVEELDRLESRRALAAGLVAD